MLIMEAFNANAQQGHESVHGVLKVHRVIKANPENLENLAFPAYLVLRVLWQFSIFQNQDV